MLIASPAIVINSQLRKLNYDPLKSFEPICLLVNSPNVIAVNSASPYHALGDLFDAARAKPGDLTLAAVGPATSSHIAIEMLKRVANVSMTFIPYPGAPPAVNALLGEHVTAFFGSYPNVAVNLSAGKLRALATASRTRIDLLPDVPTIAELDTKTTRQTSGSDCLRPRRLQRTWCPNCPDGSVRHCRMPRSRRSLLRRGYIRPGFAARILKRSFANSMKNMVASSAQRTSGLNEPDRPQIHHIRCFWVNSASLRRSATRPVFAR